MSELAHDFQRYSGFSEQTCVRMSYLLSARSDDTLVGRPVGAGELSGRFWRTFRVDAASSVRVGIVEDLADRWRTNKDRAAARHGERTVADPHPTDAF